jgi:hypothetical protein
LLFPASTAQMRKRTQFEQNLWITTPRMLVQNSLCFSLDDKT